MRYKVIFLSGLDIWSLRVGVGAPSFYNTLKLYLDKGEETVLIKPTGRRHVAAEIPGLRQVLFHTDLFDDMVAIPKVSFFGRLFGQWYKTLRFRALAERELRSSDLPCLLYAYEINGVRAAKRLAEKYRVPLVTRFQGTVLHTMEDTWVNRLKFYPHYEALAEKSDCVIMTNDGTRGLKVLRELGNPTQRVYFWRNGVSLSSNDAEDLAQARRRQRESWHVGEDDFVFLTLSRLAGWKRIDRALKAFAEIAQSHPDARLVVVGEGDKRGELEALAASLGVGDRVRFPGGVDQAGTWSCYNAADVFLSLYDLGNMGNPLFEALFWGKPIVTLNNGDTATVIEDGYNALMLEPDREDLIPGAMSRLIEDGELRERLSRNARQYAKENLWTWDQRMEAEYKAVTEMADEFYSAAQNAPARDQGGGCMPKATWKAIYREDLRATGLLDAPLSLRVTDRRFRFYRSLRRAEYYTNCRHDPLGRLLGKLLRLRHLCLCQRYGWTIPLNVFGPGLALVHAGTIVVSGDARIGENCRLNVCTNIGRAETGEGTGAPILGDDVYLGPGAKLFGPIVIGDCTAIGANAVVNRSFPEGHCTLAGVPARVVSDKGSERFILK